MSVKNSSDTIGNRTRDVPACSAVPQPNVPPRASLSSLVAYKIKDKYHSNSSPALQCAGQPLFYNISKIQRLEDLLQWRPEAGIPHSLISYLKETYFRMHI
jgi:hypothetical protein